MPAAPPPLPPRPEPPDPADCCGSGCARCIFDVYDDELARWREACARIEAQAAPDGTVGTPPTRD